MALSRLSVQSPVGLANNKTPERSAKIRVSEVPFLKGLKIESLKKLDMRSKIGRTANYIFLGDFAKKTVRIRMFSMRMATKIWFHP